MSLTDFRATIGAATPKLRSSSGISSNWNWLLDPRTGHRSGDTQIMVAGAGSFSATDHRDGDAQPATVGSGPIPVSTSQKVSDTHTAAAGADGALPRRSHTDD